MDRLGPKKGYWLVLSAMIAALCLIGFGRFASAVTQVVTINPPTQSSIKESGINLIFSVRRVGSTLGTLTVNYSIGGTATNGRDYNGLSRNSHDSGAKRYRRYPGQRH